MCCPSRVCRKQDICPTAELYYTPSPCFRSILIIRQFTLHMYLFDYLHREASNIMCLFLACPHLGVYSLPRERNCNHLNTIEFFWVTQNSPELLIFLISLSFCYSSWHAFLFVCSFGDHIRQCAELSPGFALKNNSEWAWGTR